MSESLPQPLDPGTASRGAAPVGRDGGMAQMASSGALPLWLAPALLAAVLLAYFPALHGGLVWDDAAHVTAPALRSWAGLGRIWFELGATQQYYPLLHTAFWLEHRLWGDSVAGYHLVNVVLHAAAAWLAARVLHRLAIPGAAWAALLFALHPVQVESVAWISEQKNTLSTVFYLGAALLYLDFDRRRAPGVYAGALGLFVAGLLTKTVIATLPATLVVVLWWQRGRLSLRREVGPLVPWFALGAAAGLFTAWVERSVIGAHGAAYDFPWSQRLLLAGRAPWFYFGKLLWPEDLTFIYPRWILDAARPLAWLGPLALVVALVALWRIRPRSRAPLAVALIYLGSLFPVLGFVNLYPFIYSFVADHFQYLATLALAAAAGVALAGAIRRSRAVGLTGALALLAGLGVLTRRQAATYRDIQTLYRTTIARNPACWMAYNNLGELLQDDPATRPEAIADFRRALELRPDYFEAENNLGLALTQSGQPAAALSYLQAAIRLRPAAIEPRNNLGIALASTGHLPEAAATFTAALTLAPHNPRLHTNLAKVLQLQGHAAEAAAHVEEARRLQAAPDTPAR